jgi:hypothetical protein
MSIKKICLQSCSNAFCHRKYNKYGIEEPVGTCCGRPHAGYGVGHVAAQGHYADLGAASRGSGVLALCPLDIRPSL